jgi:hypothetical protein
MLLQEKGECVMSEKGIKKLRATEKKMLRIYLELPKDSDIEEIEVIAGKTVLIPDEIKARVARSHGAHYIHLPVQRKFDRRTKEARNKGYRCSNTVTRPLTNEERVKYGMKRKYRRQFLVEGEKGHEYRCCTWDELVREFGEDVVVISKPMA